MFEFLRRRIHPVIEPLRIEQAGECARLHAQFFAYPWTAADLESMIASAGHAGDAATDPGNGRLSGFIITRSAADEAEVLTIAVDKSAQGGGIGKALLTSQMDYLRTKRIRTIFLEVDEGNEPARRLYENSGFLLAGTRPGYYRNPQGKPANALILSCDL